MEVKIPKNASVTRELAPCADYLTVREAAKMLGVSARSVYGYIATGKLAGERLGQTIVLRKTLIATYQRPTVGRPRRRLPVWRKPVADNQQYLLTIRVPMRPGQDQRFQQKLLEIRQARQHLIPGTVARYISRIRSEPEEIQITLLWRQRLMPPEEARQAALAALRADLSDVLDWEKASCREGQVVLNT